MKTVLLIIIVIGMMDFSIISIENVFAQIRDNLWYYRKYVWHVSHMVRFF